jgi:aminoglycoside 6'-N-acetyltransferase I
VIKQCTSVDQPGWLALREALWPGSSRKEHLAEMSSFLASPSRYAQFIAYSAAGDPCGFVEASVRSDYVNGTHSSPVVFLEGLYVAPERRRNGFAKELVSAVAAWAQREGHSELASDALLDNELSHAVHRALGFGETERVVFFRKALEGA